MRGGDDDVGAWHSLVVMHSIKDRNNISLKPLISLTFDREVGRDENLLATV